MGDEGHRLLHFLKQRCQKDGGTYWLFREEKSSQAKLYDMSPADDILMEDDSQITISPLAVPIATMCLQMAQKAESLADHRRLLKKGLSMLEPVRYDYAGAYAYARLQLALSWTSPPKNEILPNTAARLSEALKHLEHAMKVLAPWYFFETDGPSPETSREEDDTHTESLLQQVHISYAETVV